MIAEMMTAATLCLPPGVSLEGLTVLHASQMYAPVEGEERRGEPVDVAWYGPAGSTRETAWYIVYRLQERVVGVDDHPGSLEPDWLLREVVSPRGRLRPPGSRPEGCTWKRGVTEIDPEEQS